MASLATPQAQMERAKTFYDRKSYEEAYKEYQKVIANFKDSKEAPEALYNMGLCLVEMKKYKKAFITLQKVVDSYPHSSRINDIIARELEIAEMMVRSTERRFAGMRKDVFVEHPAVAVFDKIIDNAPYSQEAITSYYKKGLLFKELERYEEASEAFRTLTEKYPDSRMYESAKYQLALSAKAASLRPAYDQELTKEARKNFKELADKRSETVVGMDVRKELSLLDEKDAQKTYDTAAFYEKQKNFKSAKIYFKTVVAKYPSTSFGERAAARVKALEEAGQ